MDDTRASFEMAARFFRMNRWEQALAEFLKIEVADAEKNEELAYYLGLCCTKLERYEDAVLHLEQVAGDASNPLRVYQCRLTLAYIYVKTGRFKLAEFELGRVQSQGFESVQVYTTLAFAAWAQKQYQKAIDYYEKALELDGDSGTALNGLGYILADSELDAPRGVSLCRKAVDKNPRSAAYLDSLGWACYKNGEAPEARSWLRRALELAPHQKEIREHLRAVPVYS